MIQPDDDRVMGQQHRFGERFGLLDGDESSCLARALRCAEDIERQMQGKPWGVDVALKLLGLGVDQETLIAALLSDPRLRDSLTLDSIRDSYGDSIAKLVSTVHWLNTFRECERKEIKAPEQTEGLRRMLLAMVKDMRAMLIMLVYRLQRLRLLPSESYEIRQCIARETLDIYAPLAHRLGIAQLKWELEDLAFRYLEPQAYKRIATELEEKRAARVAYVETFVKLLSKAIHDAHFTAEVSGRPKHIYSIWRKMCSKGRSLEALYDLHAVRVIVDKVSECYGVLGVVHAQWHYIPQEFDDYIANPKGNGYQSLHTAVIGPQGKIVEVQIRTRSMHEFAERGVAAHWLYKEGRSQNAVAQSNVASLQHLLEADNDGAALLEGLREGILQDRVFVFTPAGEIQELPLGATPLDFAYCIHTEVGHRCRGAKVNGRIVPLSYQLKSGEQVEILTTKQERPSRDWLNPQLGFLSTSRARSKVRNWFKRQDRDQNIQDGRIMIERELQRLGLRDADLQVAVKASNLHSVEDFYAEVGRGEISPVQVAGMLQVPNIPLPSEASNNISARQLREPSSSEIKIKGVGNLLTKIARCCGPVPGDPITGYITRGKGVTVHRADCSNILTLSYEQRDRIIEVEWGAAVEVYPVKVRIEAYHRQRLLEDIVAILGKEKVNLLRANTNIRQDAQHIVMDMTLAIANTEQLSRLLAKIVQVSNVVQARRLPA
jgi:GTP pyrophosphokinase